MRLTRVLAAAAAAVACLSVTGCQGRSAAGPPPKVLVVIEENHSLQQMKDDMPYLFSLSTRYGYATDYTAIRHPSLPNYLAVAGGSTFGVDNDGSPAANSPAVGDATSVFDQAVQAGKTAGTYAEDMPEPCHVDNYPVDKPSYSVRHNPWVYFTSGRSHCRVHDVPLTGFAQDAKEDRLPNIGFLIPNLCHDAHSCPLASADDFLRSTLPAVLESDDFRSGRLVVVVTADEDDKRSGNVVLTSVLSSRLSHTVVGTPLTHYSLSRYLSEVVGATPLHEAATAPDLGAAFGL